MPKDKPQDSVERLRVLLESMNGIAWDAESVARWESQMAVFDRDVVY
jgi:hypothetical protein